MNCIKYYTQDGRIINSYEGLKPDEDIITKIEVDFIGLGKVEGYPWVVLENYQKYMFQKYSMTVIGAARSSTSPLAGFQVGGYKEDVGWVIFDVNFTARKIEVTLVPEITSNAILKGTKYAGN